MLRINVQGLTADVFRRLQIDAVGAGVRTLLGNGAASVIHVRDLTRTPLPPAPFAALRRQSIAGPPGGPHLVTFVWHLYDDVAIGHYRINGLLLPIAQAYEDTPLPITSAAISAVDAESSGDERIDSALQRPVCTLTLRITC